MDRKNRNKQSKKKLRTDSWEEHKSPHENGSSNADIGDAGRSMHAQSFGSSAVVTRRAVTASVSYSQPSFDRTCAQATPSMFNQAGRQHQGDGTWREDGGGRQCADKSHGGSWRGHGDRNYRDSRHRNPAGVDPQGSWRGDDSDGNRRTRHRRSPRIDSQGSWQEEKHATGETQQTPKKWKNCYRGHQGHGNQTAYAAGRGKGSGGGAQNDPPGGSGSGDQRSYRNTPPGGSGSGDQRSYQNTPPGGSGSGDQRSYQNTPPGGSGGVRRKTKRGKRGGQRKKNTQTESSSIASGASAASSLEIPGFYYDPEKKRYFKIQSPNFVVKGDESVVTHESIRKKQAEAQRQKDLADFKAGSDKRTVCSATSSSDTDGPSYHTPSYHPLTTMLLHGYQRGEVSRSALEQAWILSSASQLQPTGTHSVSDSLQEDLRVEHMLQMEASQEHDQVLCLWSLAGTTVQQLKLVSLQHPPTPKQRTSMSRKLAVGFATSPELGDFQSWNKITSMCWSEFPQCPGRKFVLYTTMCHTGQVCSLAFIRCLGGDTPAGFDHLSYNLGKQAIWTCAWNNRKQRFGVGTEKGCVIIDSRTRQKWQYNTMNSDVLAQVFTKSMLWVMQEDGGNVMYTGIRRGSILQHDLRMGSATPVSHSAMSHQSSVCCLRLSPEENYVYASDFLGGIKKWDLRMRKEVLTYDGLFNRQCKLPFHIDETQSLLYAAGQDCYTKLWCLKTGKQLLSIPPPYEASLYSIPAVRFSTRWGGSPGNMGLIMGAHKNFYLYSLQTCEE